MENIYNFFYSKKNLNSNIFNKDIMKEKVRKLLLQIASFVINQIGIEKNRIKDIILTGSLASYNWDNYSDIDLHIVISTKNLNDNEKKYLVDFLQQTKTNINSMYNFKIADHKIEIYFQDSEELNESLGVYSVLKNKWIKHPKHVSVEINKKLLKIRLNKILDEINYVVTNYPNDWNRIKKLFDKITALRKEKFKSPLLKTEEKIFSINNLIFKILRRKNILSKLKNYMNNIKSKQFSLEMKQQKCH